MQFIKFFGLFLIAFSSCLNAQQTQVYQAMAGAVPQVNQNVMGNQASQNAFQQTSPINNSQNQLSAIPNNNIFLEYYAKQGDDFSASVYYNESGNLAKRDISFDNLKKTFVVFFGDWCPHCHKFLTEFSKHIETLKSKGVKIVFLNVPSVDKLRNWQDPTMKDYEEAKDKINSYGIELSPGVDLVLLGERATLARSGIEGLPVVVSVKNGQEYFRGIGANGVSKLQFSNPDILRQFLEIWDDEHLDNPDKSDKSSNKSDEKKKKPAKSKVSKNKKSKKVSRKKTNRSFPKKLKPKSEEKISTIESKTATEFLNSNLWQPTLNSIQYNKSKKQKPKRRGCTCSVRTSD